MLWLIAVSRLVAEVREDAVVERLPVGADRRGLVAIARACPDDARLGCGEPLLGCLSSVVGEGERAVFLCAVRPGFRAARPAPR